MLFSPQFITTTQVSPPSRLKFSCQICIPSSESWAAVAAAAQQVPSVASHARRAARDAAHAGEEWSEARRPQGAAAVTRDVQQHFAASACSGSGR
jgi:hypothetical protein